MPQCWVGPLVAMCGIIIFLLNHLRSIDNSQHSDIRCKNIKMLNIFNCFPNSNEVHNLTIWAYLSPSQGIIFKNSTRTLDIIQKAWPLPWVLYSHECLPFLQPPSPTRFTLGCSARKERSLLWDRCSCPRILPLPKASADGSSELIRHNSQHLDFLFDNQQIRWWIYPAWKSTILFVIFQIELRVLFN